MPETPRPAEPLRRLEPDGKHSEMIINPMGAKIDLLRLGGRTLLKQVTRGDGKLASTHPCTPVFGPDKKNLYGLSQHGNMRTTESNVLLNEPNHVILSHDIQEGTYPPGMNVLQEFELEDGLFRLKTVHTNNNKNGVAAPVNFAEHFYWDTPEGWDGLKVNGKDVTSLIKADVAEPWLEENVLEIPGQPPIYIKQIGMGEAMYWVGSKEGTNGQPKEYDQTYAAVEAAEFHPVSFGEQQTMIEAGDSRTTELIISV